jgi:hypothetical protein
MKLLVSILLSSVLDGPAQAQVPAPMNKKVASYAVQADTFIDALLKIATRFEFPLAVEWVKTADTLQPVRPSQNETTAAAVLDAVVSSHPGYAWQVENGIVHVFPKSIVTDSRNPLNVRISGFPKGPLTVTNSTIRKATLFLEAIAKAGPFEQDRMNQCHSAICQFGPRRTSFSSA